MHDPYYVTPILMGASQFWQTKMMPPTGDPAQQRMMMFMPLMFLVFFLWAPSGLVLYWLCSNLWTIGQQYFTNRCSATPQPATGALIGARDADGDGAMRSELHGEVKAFVEQVVEAMGLAVAVEVSDLEDGSVRVDVQGEEGELLLRRKGEGLDALQHLVNSAYRRDVGRDQRIVIDAHGLPPGQGRRAAADGEVPDREGADAPARRRSSARSTRTRAASCTSKSAATTTSPRRARATGS